MEEKPMTILPPHPSLCQQCATAHAPEEPHNRESLYYQIWFYNQHGRYPTWADACAHADAALQARWRDELASMGVPWDRLRSEPLR